MSKIVPFTSNAPLSVDTLSTALQRTRNELASANMSSLTGKTLLRMDKSGAWLYGQDAVEVEEDSLWAVNPLSLQHGYISWENDKNKAAAVLGEAMVSIQQPLPDVSSLPNTGSSWDKQFLVQLRCLSGADEGLEVIYKTTSSGGIDLFKDLIDKVMQQLETGQIVPVVVLGSTNYKHKTYGKVYKPSFEYKSWLALDADPADVDTDTEDDPNPEKPSRRRRRPQ